MVADHLQTLTDDRTGRRSYVDIFLFYGIPVAVAALGYAWCLEVPKGVSSVLVGALSFFAGLLFSAQIALYSILPRDFAGQADPVSEARERKRGETTRRFFSHLNANISYCILLGATTLFAVVSFQIISFNRAVESALIITLSLHFFLTLLMLVKRMHAAFKSEIENNSQV